MATNPYKYHEKIINGVTYTIMPFPARYGLNILAQLSKYASNVLRFIIPSLGSSSSIKSVMNTPLTDDVIDQFITALQQSLTDEKLIDLLFAMVKYVNREGKELANEDYFNLVFAENYEEFFLLIKEVIVINFLSQSFIKGMFLKMLEQQNQQKKPLTKNG